MRYIFNQSKLFNFHFKIHFSNILRNIPRSILISVPIITALYVFMNFAYLIVLTPAEMVNSPAVAVEFGERVFGVFSFFIPLGVSLATFGCALSIQFSVTRLCFVAGREGHFLASMSYIHHERMTPGPAVALQVKNFTFANSIVTDLYFFFFFEYFRESFH